MKGTHLLGELYGCGGHVGYLGRLEPLRELCISKVRAAGLTVLGDSFYQFEPEGVTGSVILAESHIAIHTWPESGYVTLDVFVCNYQTDNTAKAHWLYEELIKAFRPERANKQVVERG